jgi:hypothetical protein
VEKRQKQQFKKVWKSLKTMFKVLFIAIVIFILIQLLLDFIHHYDFIVRKVTEQGDTIEQLRQQLHTVSDTNVQLNEHLQLTQTQLDLANLQIDELTNEKLVQQAPQVSISGQPVVMTTEDIKQEIEPQLKFPDSTGPAAVVIGVLTVLKTLVFRIPAF